MAVITVNVPSPTVRSFLETHVRKKSRIWMGRTFLEFTSAVATAIPLSARTTSDSSLVGNLPYASARGHGEPPSCSLCLCAVTANRPRTGALMVVLLQKKKTRLVLENHLSVSGLTCLSDPPEELKGLCTTYNFSSQNHFCRN